MKPELNILHFNNDDIISTSSLCLSPDSSYAKYKYYGLTTEHPITHSIYLIFEDDEGDGMALDGISSYSYNGSPATSIKPNLIEGNYYHVYDDGNGVLSIWSCNDSSHKTSNIDMQGTS